MRTAENIVKCKIVRYAKYDGTMIGPDNYIHRWTAPRKKFIQRVLKINSPTKSLVERLCEVKINSPTKSLVERLCEVKINSPTKSLVERLCEVKICAIAVLSFLGFVCAPNKETNKVLRIMLFNVQRQGPYNAIAFNLLGVVCGLWS